MASSIWKMADSFNEIRTYNVVNTILLNAYSLYVTFNVLDGWKSYPKNNGIKKCVT